MYSEKSSKSCDPYFKRVRSADPKSGVTEWQTGLAARGFCQEIFVMEKSNFFIYFQAL